MSTRLSSGVRRNGSNMFSSPRPAPAGTLIHKDHTGKILGRKTIFPNHQLVIGRDKVRCQYVLNDPYTSKRHLRIYTVVYDNDEPSDVDTLVYAEDLSQNGTYWNGSFIGKGNGGFLLSDQDVLRLSRRTYLLFTAVPTKRTVETFDFIQETEMARFRKDYVLTDRLLGAGAFGRVVMAIDQSTRRQLACKVIDLRVLMPGAQTRFGRADQPEAAEDIDSRAQVRKVKAWAVQQKRKDALERQLSKYFRELDILASISHPNIIGIEKAYVTDNTMYMMQEIVTAGDLFSYIESKNGKLLEVEAAVIVRQILIALSFLHSKNIVHRDIKPDNILMTSLAAGCRVVLTDFGAARRIENKSQRMTSIIGTHEYAAPEILRCLAKNIEPERPGYTKAVDMWAVGCVAVVLLTGGLAFCDPITNTYSEKLARDCDLEFLRASKEWKVVRQRPKSFVEQLLVLDEDARLTADAALRHSWFYNEVHKNDFEDLYQRTIKHWQPRITKSQTVEFQDTGSIRTLGCALNFFRPTSRINTHSSGQVEPHFKPFPRKMHQVLWPPRSATKGLTKEVLSMMERSSPHSAVLLRIRAESMSPTSRPAPPPRVDPQTIRPLRRSRAMSEPPPVRVGLPSPARNPLISGPFATAAPWKRLEEQHAPNTPKKMKPFPRPPTPKPQKRFSGLSLPVSTDQTSQLADPFIAQTTLPGDAPEASLVNPQASSPEPPEANFEISIAATPSQPDPEPTPKTDVTTPPSNSKLKRRPSTNLATPTFKRHRGASIFDLGDEVDSAEPALGHKPARPSVFDLDENHVEKSSLPRRPLAHRLKPVPKTLPGNLYLPR